METQLVELGRCEYAKLSDEERAGIVQQFQEVTSGMKEKTFKSKTGRSKKVARTRQSIKN